MAVVDAAGTGDLVAVVKQLSLFGLMNTKAEDGGRRLLSS
jgi:hypothetical protein